MVDQEAEQAEPEQPLPRRRKVGRSVQTFLVSDRSPMWMTLGVLLMGATGTYYLAPRVNAEFEAQKLKSDFVVKNYNDLRLKTEDLMALTGLITNKMARSENVDGEIIRLLDINSRLVAHAITLLPMFTHAEGPQAIVDLQLAMRALTDYVQENAGRKLETEEDITAHSQAMVQLTGKIVPPMLQMLVRVADIGGLRPVEATTDLKPKGD
jgi:hypothetical protein